MLHRLSKYQQEVSLTLLSIFIISGLAPLKANASERSNHMWFSPKAASGISFTGSKSFGYAAVAENNGTGQTITAGKYYSGSKEKNTGTFEGSSTVNEPAGGGPGQPEMTAFKSVNADNMVDLFSGDMSYNIPLLDVGGYPVNIFYNSNITMDQEASWVGLGWNINPGTIMRNMRGVPDDFNGTDKIKKTLSFRPDKTWGVGVGGGLEIVSLPLGLSGNLGISFNNQRGIGMEFGVNPHININKNMGDDKTATLSLGVGLNLNSQTGATVTPSISVQMKEDDNAVGSHGSGSLSASVGYNSRVGLQSLHLDAEVSKTKTSVSQVDCNPPEVTSKTGTMGTMSSSISFAYPSVTPSIRTRLSRMNMSASIKLGWAQFLTHPNVSFNGYYSQSRVAEDDKEVYHPAYGVMFYQKANDDPNALLDFNRLQDGVFTKSNPTIAIPAYSYDVFSISGEGIGGSFRAYRSDLGYVHDATVATRDDAGRVGFDVGLGPLAAHTGVNLEYVYTPAVAGAWRTNNMALNSLRFRESKGAYQSVYFKNPGEKTIPDKNFQEAIGGEDLVRLRMTNYQTGSPVLLPSFEKFDRNRNYLGSLNIKDLATMDRERDKRTQVISCLSAEEASRIGFDNKINSYPEVTSLANNVVFGDCSPYVNHLNRNTGGSVDPSDNYRQGHHISEIDVLGGDGRRYVYGLPVYNIKQIDATFNVKGAANENKISQRIGYTAEHDDTKLNDNNKDWYVEKEELPAYTHSFLLTELLSPNYVDVTGNGITEDDMGDAIKFNYSKKNNIKWRTPAEKESPRAAYNEGLKTTNQDDKGHYTYGEREQWYLYSIESKNMIARFYANKQRHDNKQVLGNAGGIDKEAAHAVSNDKSNGAMLLQKIDLFSKADLIKAEKEGKIAKPIKTVHFEYDYSLCKYLPTNDDLDENFTPAGGGATYNINEGRGKLTLRAIYFTYNGNTKRTKNKYRFYYPDDRNPDYDYTASNRWGNYKPAIDNQGGLTNADYPYAIHETSPGEEGVVKDKAEEQAAAWVMNKIVLPSGGIINVEYESDDYAYVQDRRAASMYEILGFGSEERPAPADINNKNLYDRKAIIQPSGLQSALQVFEEYNYVYIKVPFQFKLSDLPTRPKQREEVGRRYFNSKTNQLLMKISVTMPSDENGSGSEIIPMYTDVDDYGIVLPPDESPDIYSNTIWVKVKKLKDHSAMVQYALQFIKNSLPGKAYPGYDNTDGGLAGVITALGGMLHAVSELFSGVDNTLMGDNICRFTVPDESFARLTNPYYKKYGGGLRVKKVTMSDNWNRMTGQPNAFYGQEYNYTIKEIIDNGDPQTISSGVASWEPGIGGEENPHREALTYYNHNKGGPFDYNSVELPLAEMFFPSPSVGYRHVEVSSINKTNVKNAVGKTVSEYYTTREFPTKSDYTFLEDRVDGGASFHEDPTVLAILHIKAGKYFALSQGFRVILNDMNGKLKVQAAYGSSGQLITRTENFYNIEKATDNTYSFKHVFPTINKPDGIVENSVIGRDIEIMMDTRHHNSQTISTNINLNIEGQVIGIFPLIVPPMLSPVFFEENDYRSAAVLKIINHYGIIERVENIDRGSKISTENLIYDAETGNPLLTNTQNEHNKPVYTFNYPAHWAYSGMGPAYKNIDILYSGLVFNNGVLSNAAEADVDMTKFESGDELYVYTDREKAPSPGPCEEAVCEPKNPANRIWAVNAQKGGGADKWVFMDANGNPYSADNVYMRIVRSGHRNFLEQMVGAVTSLASPVVQQGDIKRVIFNDETRIINTTAASFSDHWRIDDILFRTCTTEEPPLSKPARKTGSDRQIGNPLKNVPAFLKNDYGVIKDSIPKTDSTEFKRHIKQQSAAYNMARPSSVLASAACTNDWLKVTTNNSYVTAGDIDVTGNKITIECEFYTDSSYQDYSLVAKNYDASVTNYLLRTASAKISTTTGTYEISAPCNFVPQKTNHVALVYNGNTLKFYRNGYLMAQTPANGNLETNDLVTTIAQSLRESLSETYINEVRIWNVDRTKAQIAEYINKPLSSPATEPGLVAYYNFSSLVNLKNSSIFPATILGSTASIANSNPVCNYFVADSCEYVPPVSCDNWLDLGGRTNCVTIGDLDVSGHALTVEAMFNARDYNSVELVSKHWYPGDVNYLLRTVRAELTTSTQFYVTEVGCPYELNKTYHVAMVYDGATLKFYRDGSLISSVPATGDVYDDNNYQTTIGETGAYLSGIAGQEPDDTRAGIFNGYINEVRIWKVARTQEEIRNNMFRPLLTPNVEHANNKLLAYYSFDDLRNKADDASYPGVLHGTDAAINSVNPQCPYIADSCTAVTCTTFTCVSKFINLFTNPYIEGIFGNWRTDKSYVYYGTRKETLADGVVDTRNGGTITGYENFWNFADNPDPLVLNYLGRNESVAAGKVWKCNNTITQYNRKGYETESKDALDRFSAGLYGYNQQLPVAVANNARLMEVMYDGFEDYGYDSRNCETVDCKPKRHADFGDILGNRATEEKHTGKYSLKIEDGHPFTLDAHVISKEAADEPYSFDINIITQPCTKLSISDAGTGYTPSGGSEDGDALYHFPDPTPNINFIGSQYGDWFNMSWTGYLLAPENGEYSFQILGDEHFKFWLFENNDPTNKLIDFTVSWWDGAASRNAVLEKGKTYKIIAITDNDPGNYSAVLKWKTPAMICNGENFAFIPTKHIYPLTAVPGNIEASYVTSTPIQVDKLDKSQPSGNFLNSKFTLLQGKTMVLSAWVKETRMENECAPETYENNEIQLSFETSSGTIVYPVYTPKGNIIEGWQRYEVEFKVPDNAENFSMTLNGKNGKVVYFDDIRIHPFNANEKTFVYHPANLRLMAELDENNYASFYEYDDEGTLTRVKKETERGIKTIKETRSALQKVEY